MAKFLDSIGLSYLWDKIKALVSTKADKVSDATDGNFAGLDATGNLTDSGYKPSDFLTEHQHLPEYTIEKLAQAETSYSASYVLKKDGTQVGATINIPKDMVVSSGEVKTVTTANVPYQGAQVGDKYIDLTIANTSQNHIYIPVKDLVDVYVAGNGIRISDNNYISVVVDSNNANGLGVGGSGLALYHVTPSVNGSGGSDGAMLATDKEKLDGIAAGAEENVIETVKVSGTALQVTGKAVNIETETAYDPATNKIATMSDVESATPNVGHLKTDNSASLTPSASESFTGDISLHTVAKTGSYKDLNDKPTIPSSGDFVTSLGTSGNNVTWTKNGVTNNLTVPYATVAGKLGTTTVGGSTTAPIYLSSGVPTAITSVEMKRLGWPQSSYTALDSVGNLYLTAGSNVCANIKPSYVDVEYTNDGGTTWIDYGATDSQKVKLFTTSGGFSVGKKSSSSSTNVTSNDSVRITVHAGAGFYCHSLFMIVRLYCPARCSLKVEYTTYSAQTTLVEHDTYNAQGNPTYLVIPFDKYIFGNNGVHDFRITLTYNGTGYVTSSHRIAQVKIYSNNVYSSNSNLASTNHIYSYDENQNAVFPANVTAAKLIKSGGTSSQFLKADGSVDSNTYATTSQLPSLPLSIANGGTGQTTGVNAANALIGALPTWTADPSDDVYLIRRDTGGSSSFGQVKFSTVWNYIKSKIASVLGIDGSNGVPTAPTAAAGTNTTQIATTAFVSSATSGLAIDDEVVHKAGAETITGEKTFSANVNLTEGATLNMVYDSQTPDGVYIEATESNGIKTVAFKGISDDGLVRITNVNVPVNDTDATPKWYVDESILDIDEYRVYFACQYGPYGVHQKSLCAFCLTNGGREMKMTSFTKKSGLVAKEVITDLVFPIGCKIYYNDSSTDSSANLSSMANRYYTSFNGVDVRYSAVTGTSISLGNYPSETQSTVYLHVIVEDGYWRPYYKEGATNEIIVDSFHMQSGNFYIYLGKTVRNTGYMIQLEDNNPLYYYDGTQLVDYATWIASQNTPQSTYEYKKFDMQYQEMASGGLIVYDWDSSSLGSLSNGTYKVTVQRHAYSSVTRPSVLHMTLRYGGGNSWVGISASTSIIPAAIQTQDAYDPLGAITVVMVGFLTLGDQRNNLKLVQEGVSGLCLGGELPYGGSCIESVVVNDFVLLEKIG